MSWKNKKAVSLRMCNTCLYVILWLENQCAGIPVCLCGWAMERQEVIEKLCLRCVSE